MEETDSKTLVKVAFNNTTEMYSVELAAGSNIAETAFCMTLIIKCLLKDGIIKDANEITDRLAVYLTDPQYEEVTQEDNNVKN